MLAIYFYLYYELFVLGMVPSSRGLGRGPLKAATRVRIPLGSPIQTALFLGRCFALWGKAFSEFGCRVFENGILG